MYGRRLERIKSFNTQLKGNVDYLIDLDLIAEPFLGNKEANVVILGLNPGIYKKKDDEKYKGYDVDKLEAINGDLFMMWNAQKTTHVQGGNSYNYCDIFIFYYFNHVSEKWCYSF